MTSLVDWVQHLPWWAYGPRIEQADFRPKCAILVDIHIEDTADKFVHHIEDTVDKFVQKEMAHSHRMVEDCHRMDEDCHHMVEDSRRMVEDSHCMVEDCHRMVEDSHRMVHMVEDFL